MKIYRKLGWILNPNDENVNTIIDNINNNNGICPNSGHECPCDNYIKNNTCICGLYLKLLEKSTS